MLAELLACEDGVFVRRAYWVLLGREPDPGGLVNYLDRLHTGTSKQQILVELSDSIEGRAKDTATAASLAMAGGLAPAPSSNAALRNLWSVSSWDELVANHGRAFLSCAYQTLLGRDVDPDGSSYYQARLRAGASKVQVLCALRYSGEYRSRVALLRELRRKLPQMRSGTTQRTPPLPVSGVDAAGPTPTVGEVLAYDDESLVNCLCSLALGAGGKDFQTERDALARLQGGWSALRVLQTIEKSPEGRQRRALLRRLDREIVKHFLARIPLLGRVLAAAFAIDGDTPLERRLRRIEYRVLGSSEEVHRAGELRRQPSHADSSAGAVAVATARPGPGGIAHAEPERNQSAMPGAAGELRSLPAPTDWGDQ